MDFKIAKPVLERAFRDTYGIEMKDVFRTEDLAFESFRYSVGSIIPGMTRVAWQLKKDTLVKEMPGVTKKKFLFNLSRSSYEKQWGTGYHRPGFGTRLVSVLLRLSFRNPALLSRWRFDRRLRKSKRCSWQSFNATIDNYRTLLANVDAGKPGAAE